MLWSWVCLFLSTTIILIGYEIVFTPNAIQGNYNRTLCANLTNNEAPADRLVMFLVSSLPDDTVTAKWIKTIVTNYGRGTAIASRPVTRSALLAMFAGHYEILLNSLPFIGYAKSDDHIFLHTDNVYYFGPNTWPRLFTYSENWNSYTYTNKWLDLEGKADLADDYVLDYIQEMFTKQDSKEQLNRTNIYYIHFTSIYLLGHMAKYGSDRLDKGIDKLADMINKTVTYFDKHFTDNRTVYMIMSDHGQTGWGTHGDYLPEEVRTPLVIWGSQIANGNLPTIKQIDICPLISAIFGKPVPSKSLGILNEHYLNTSSSTLAYSTVCNALQLAQLCQTTWNKIDNGYFIKHILARTMSTCGYNRYLKSLTKLMSANKYEQTIMLAKNLTISAQHCLTNVQNFYKTSFLFVLLMSYFGWIFGTLCMMASQVSNRQSFTTCAGKILAGLTCLGYLAMTTFSIASVILENLPYYYIIFVVVPSIAWLMTTLKTSVCLATLLKMKQLRVMLYIFGVLAMVEFTYWAKYSPFLFAAYLMPYSCVIVAMNHKYVPFHVPALYLITCVVIAVGPLIPLLGLPESTVLLNVASALWIVGSCFFSYVLEFKAKQCLTTLAMVAVICLSTWVIDLKYLGAYTVLKVFAWVILAIPLLTVFASSVLAERLLQVVVSLASPYLLLSARHEPIMLLIIALNLYAYLRLEASAPQYGGQDIVRGITLHYYIVLSILACGNVPYLSSYDTLWSRLFISHIDDVLIAILIIYKLIIVITLISCFFCATCLYVGTGLEIMLLVALVTFTLTSARHSLGIIIANDSIARFPEFVLGNVMFLILVLPFNLAPFIVNVKKKSI